MESLNFSVDNIIEGDAIGVAMTGMLIVFAALCLVSLFIAVLPRIPGVVTESAAHETPPAPPQPATMRPDEGEIAAAIGYVLHERLRRRRSGH